MHEDGVQTVVIASQNPVKAEAVRRGFERAFPDRRLRLEQVPGNADVRAQPMSDAETLRGAESRASAAGAQRPGADHYVGIEGGVEEQPGGLLAFAWVVVKSAARIGRGRTGTFFLPDVVARLVRAGRELGEADDEVFRRTNSKQEEGAVGILTGGIIDRARLYEEAVVLALIPFRSPDLYPMARSDIDDDKAG